MRAFQAVLALTVSLLFASNGAANANERTIFSGCVIERDDTSILLASSSDANIRIDTTWIPAERLNAALTDCVTVTTLTVDGRFVAESIEAGDEPNEVNAVTNETTNDRERRHHRQDNDNKGGKKNKN